MKFIELKHRMYPALENNILVCAAAAAHKGLRYRLVSPYMLLCLAGTATKSLPALDLCTLCTVTQIHPSTLCSRLFFPPVCVAVCVSLSSHHLTPPSAVQSELRWQLNPFACTFAPVLWSVGHGADTRSCPEKAWTMARRKAGKEREN